MSSNSKFKIQHSKLKIPSPPLPPQTLPIPSQSPPPSAPQPQIPCPPSGPSDDSSQPHGSSWFRGEYSQSPTPSNLTAISHSALPCIWQALFERNQEPGGAQ